jgi:hypothetical protein
MALTFGSLRHTTSGRKRKPLPKAKRYTPEFKELEARPSYRRETTYYPSMKETGAYAPAPDNSYKVEESKNFTIAPAYNKGAYQVINRNSIKDIGR